MKRFHPPGFLYTRPTALNWLHWAGLVAPLSQTIERELRCLAAHAAGRRRALEIGTDMGVSAAVIAAALAPDGRLYCVDPWPPHRGGENPCFSICRRELHRRGLLDRVVFVRATSGQAEAQLPGGFDFMFIDGDHSLEGIRTDWAIARRLLAPGGVVGLHDSFVPEKELWRKEPSSDYYRDVISRDPDFDVVDACHTLAVLRRKDGRANE